MKRSMIDRLMRVSILIWSISYSTPQFISNIIFQQTGVLFAYIGFYWLFYLGLIGCSVLIAWKYNHWAVKMAAIPIFIFWGYTSFQYLQPSYFILNLPHAILNVILTGILIINLVYSVVSLIIDVKGQIKQKYRLISGDKEKKIGTALSVVFLLWVLSISWSYVGFSQTYTVENYVNPDFRVNFWGYPYGSNNYSLYNNAQSDTELALYQQLNSTFIFPTSVEKLNDPEKRGNLTAVMHELEEWDIEFMCDCSPTFPWLNESGEWETKMDFVTYYYTKEINNTIDEIVSWVQAEGFTNFRGISLDIEGPIYRNESYPISREAYEAGRISFQNKMDWFKSQLPGTITNMISMDGVLWDMEDTDHDLDIASLTVGPELDFDYYGYMTYMVPSISPGTSTYKYAYYLSQGKRVHGLQFQPWIGWLSNPKSEEDPNVIENPFIYDSVIEQYKIVLSFGFDEVVIAPVRNFLGRDQLEGINRLQALIDIKNNGYDAFELKITNNMRLVNDFPLWVEKIHPVYWLSNEHLFRDLMMGTQNSWFFLAHLSTLLIISLCSVWAIKYKNKGNGTPASKGLAN